MKLFTTAEMEAHDAEITAPLRAELEKLRETFRADFLLLGELVGYVHQEPCNCAALARPTAANAVRQAAVGDQRCPPCKARAWLAGMPTVKEAIDTKRAATKGQS